MAEQKDVLDQAINNLRKMLSGEEVQREPAGSVEQSVTKDVSNIQFPAVSPEQLRQQQMDESLKTIKTQEENKERREEFPQYKFTSEKRMPAAAAIGPETKAAQSKFFTPSEGNLKSAIENLQKGLDSVKEETNTEAKRKSLEERSNSLAQQALDILNTPSDSNNQADAILKLATVRSIKSIEDQQKRMQELVDKSGQPIFEKEDTAKVAILALAPIVAGYLVDGARGGAIGAQAGQLGISKFEEQKKEQLKRSLEGLERGAKITTSMLYNDAKLAETAARLNSTERNAENIRLQSKIKVFDSQNDLISKQINQLDNLKKQGLITTKDYEVKIADLLKAQQQIAADADRTRLGISRLDVEKEKQDKVQKLPDTIKTEYNDLAKKSSNLFTLTSSLNRTLNVLKDPNVSDDQKWQAARLSFKPVNALGTQTSDVVGREEVDRIGAFAQKKFFNITKPGSSFGVDIDEYAKMLEIQIEAAKQLDGDIKARQDNLLSSVSMAQPVAGRSAPKPAAGPQGAAKPPVVREFKGKRYRFEWDAKQNKYINKGEVK